jgi:hypothetical protein
MLERVHRQVGGWLIATVLAKTLIDHIVDVFVMDVVRRCDHLHASGFGFTPGFSACSGAVRPLSGHIRR